MTNEEENNKTTKQEGEAIISETAKPVSIVDEAREIRNEIIKAKEGLKEEREKLEKIQSESLLAGSSGGNVKIEAAKEETPAEYAKKVMSGELNDKN